MSHFPQMKATTQTSVKRINLNFKSTSKTPAEVQDEDEDDRQARIFVEAHERNHDPKMVTNRKVKVVKRTNKIVKKARNGKIKRLEDYLNMGNREKRQSIANKITERAKHFKAVSIILKILIFVFIARIFIGSWATNSQAFAILI